MNVGICDTPPFFLSGKLLIIFDMLSLVIVCSFNPCGFVIQADVFGVAVCFSSLLIL